MSSCRFLVFLCFFFFFFQAEDGIRDYKVTGVQTCALPISSPRTRQVTPTRPCGCGLGGAEYLSLNSLEREPTVLALFLLFPSFEDALCPAAIFCSSPAPRTCPSGCCAPWTAPWRTTARRPSPSSRAGCCGT